MRYLRHLSLPSATVASLVSLAIPSLASADYVVATWNDNSVHVIDEGLNDISSFPTGATEPNGVATDGTIIYSGHFSTQEVWAYDLTGEVQFSWMSPSLSGCQGLELVDGELAVATNNVIDFLNPADGTFLRSIPANATGIEGLGYDGTLLWLLGDDLVGVNPADGTVVTTIPNAAAGCTYTGTGISPDGEGNLTLVCEDGSWFIVSDADGSTLASGNNGLNMYGSDLIEGASVETCSGLPLDLSTLTPNSGLTVTQLGSTADAVDDIDESAEVACWGGSDAAEHVYQFELAAATYLQIDTEGSAYDTKLGVVSGCPAGDQFCQYNDDVGGGPAYSFFPCSQYAAGSYSAIVSGFGGGVGDYALNITECAPCGDGIVDPGEECDDELESAMCDADCTFAVCGDGTINMTAAETCDDSGESATCDEDCTAAMCGDSTVNGTAGETCDDGGRSAACNDDCTSASCGDGLVNLTAGEECDGDGAGTPGETAECDPDCTTAMCGDMAVNAAAGETCDDGKESETCNADCTDAACGDDQVNAAAGEDCDDGNTDDGDGCSATCTEESGTESGDTSGDTSGDSGDSTEDGGTMADTSGADSSGGATTPNTTADSSGDGNGSEESGSTGSGGASDDGGGCGCSTENERGGAFWSMLGLLGFGATMRRRRR